MTYVVFALPRSRTAWLSRFLTYGRWTCGHEELRHMRSLADIQSYLWKPFNGTCETSAASGWRLLPKLSPNAKAIVIRRPANEVVESLMALPVPFNRGAIKAIVARADRKLDQIEARLSCLSVKFEDLVREETCKAVFEYALPYRHDHEHWHRLDRTNVQIDSAQFFKGVHRLQSNLASLAAVAKSETFKKELAC